MEYLKLKSRLILDIMPMVIVFKEGYEILIISKENSSHETENKIKWVWNLLMDNRK